MVVIYSSVCNMSSVLPPAKHIALIGSILLSANAVGQPLCDVLLRPAFHYTTNGLSLILADSSRTYGLAAETVWSFGDGTSTTTSPNHQFSQPGTYHVCLTLIAADDSFCSSTYCREVQVPLSNCAEDFIARFDHNGIGTNATSFTDTSVGISGGTWSWEFGDGSTSSEASPDHTWTLPGPHFVTLTRRSGTCVSTKGRWVEVDGNATTCGPGLFVDFVARSEAAIMTFRPNIITSGIIPGLGVWSYGDGTIDSAFIGMHYYTDPGTYQVCLLVGAIGQPGLDTCFSLVCRSIDFQPTMTSTNEQPSTSLLVWPNPSTGIVNLAWPLGVRPVIIRVLDMVGRTVLEQRSVTQPLQTLQLDALLDGQYMVEAVSDQKHFFQRIQIVR